MLQSETFVFAVKLGDLPPESGKVVKVNKRSILMVNKGGSIHAFLNRCPHQESPFGGTAYKVLGCVAGTVVCPMHEWVFDIPSGEAIGRPGFCLKPYPVQIAGDDVLVAVES
jgi:nitrite reductase (NADH) small subunit